MPQASRASQAGFPHLVFGRAGLRAGRARIPRAEVWTALLEAGKPFGITPYGLDALNTLRIEKGHVTDGRVERQHRRA